MEDGAVRDAQVVWVSDGDALRPRRWPELPPRYDAALREAVDYIVNRYEPLGIVACGTIVRGVPDHASDLDLYVIHGQPWRQRVQKFFRRWEPAEFIADRTIGARGFFEWETEAAVVADAETRGADR